MKTPSREFLIANLAYRIGLYYPKQLIQIGEGNVNANIVVIQPGQRMPERDAITGALNNFKLLDNAYRATIDIVDFAPDVDPCNGMAPEEINRYFLKELLELIKPIMVISCGADATQLLRQRKIRSFSIYSGKKYSVSDLPNIEFYATLNPFEYGYSRAPQHLKEQGKKEWTRISKVFEKLKEAREKSRWIV